LQYPQRQAALSHRKNLAFGNYNNSEIKNKTYLFIICKPAEMTLRFNQPILQDILDDELYVKTRLRRTEKKEKSIIFASCALPSIKLHGLRIPEFLNFPTLLLQNGLG
jgi:hypothetical protein